MQKKFKILVQKMPIEIMKAKEVARSAWSGYSNRSLYEKNF
jgi:hypothetical protein